MESDYEETKRKKFASLQRTTSRKTTSDYLDDNNNNNDCLTDAFISIYRNSVWCIQSIYELLFKSLWQVLLVSKEDMQYSHMDKKMISMSMNNSAGKRYPYRRLSKSNSQHSREQSSSKLNMLPNKTRVTVRSISNLNLNRSPSYHTPLTEPPNTLGTINSHIIVVPVQSSHCQNMTSTHNLPTNQIDRKQPENINLREQLADTLCRRSYEPMIFMNRGMCCGHCRPVLFPSVPFHHSGHYVPPSLPQQTLEKEKDLSQKSAKMSDASEAQSTPYSVSPSIQSHVTNSPDEDQPLTNSTRFNNETNEQNHSILSFPDHDTPLSQQSQESFNDDSQLRLDARILVDDSIQTAQEKYQRILRMSIDQNVQNHTSDSIKQIIENQSKSIFISDESNQPKSTNDNPLCQELCNKLNLSDSNQITEILRILASNAPHILKDHSSTDIPLLNHLNTIKDSENTLCSQLLLHPPFKAKRLIHLCPDGSIQVLSAVDDTHQSNNKQPQYHLNYSNSAIPSSMNQNHILTNESSLALEYETTTVDVNQMIITESTSTQQSHSKNRSILSLQQKKTVFEYKNPLEHTVTFAKETELNSDHLKMISKDNDPIVKIDLHLNDETIEINGEDDEDSLPEIVFKRIIASEKSMTPAIETTNQTDKDEELCVRRENSSKSRHNRSRSYINKNTIHTQR